MNSLVFACNNQPMTTSRKIADYFGKAHRSVMIAIRNLETPSEFNLHNYVQITFLDDKGREYPEYQITRDGFMLLVMGFTGKKAIDAKLSFLAAFNAMEKRLRNQSESTGWKQARLQLKESRADLTDAVKSFVEYAEKNGSKNAPMYYANITKMEYSALEMIEKGGKIPDGFRDTLDRMQIAFLTAAEQVARNSLLEGIRLQMHYKEIYVFAKQAVERYASAIKIPQIEPPKDAA